MSIGRPDPRDWRIRAVHNWSDEQCSHKPTGQRYNQSGHVDAHTVPIRRLQTTLRVVRGYADPDLYSESYMDDHTTFHDRVFPSPPTPEKYPRHRRLLRTNDIAAWSYWRIHEDNPKLPVFTGLFKMSDDDIRIGSGQPDGLRKRLYRKDLISYGSLVGEARMLDRNTVRRSGPIGWRGGEGYGGRRLFMDMGNMIVVWHNARSH